MAVIIEVTPGDSEFVQQFLFDRYPQLRWQSGERRPLYTDDHNLLFIHSDWIMTRDKPRPYYTEVTKCLSAACEALDGRAPRRHTINKSAWFRVPVSAWATAQQFLFDRYESARWYGLGRKVIDIATTHRPLDIHIAADGTMGYDLAGNSQAPSLAEAVRQMEEGVSVADGRVSNHEHEVFLTFDEWRQLSHSFQSLKPSMKGDYAGHRFVASSAPCTLDIDTLHLTLAEVQEIDASVAEACSNE